MFEVVVREKETMETALVANGELYNHRLLEEKYSLRCATRSDCECLIQLWRQMDLDGVIPDLDFVDVVAMLTFLLFR